MPFGAMAANTHVRVMPIGRRGSCIGARCLTLFATRMESCRQLVWLLVTAANGYAISDSCYQNNVLYCVESEREHWRCISFLSALCASG